MCLLLRQQKLSTGPGDPSWLLCGTWRATTRLVGFQSKVEQCWHGEVHQARGGCWGCQRAREHGAEGRPWSESYSQLFMHCLQSKCLVQTRSSIGKQEKKGNNIMLRGSGSRELRWLRGAGLGGQAENKGRPAAVAIATCSFYLHVPSLLPCTAAKPLVSTQRACGASSLQDSVKQGHAGAGSDCQVDELGEGRVVAIPHF